MKITNALKVYIFLVVLLVAAAAFWVQFSFKLKDAEKRNAVLQEELNKITVVAQKIYEYQRDVDELKEKFGQGKLDMSIILSKLRECGLKEPSTSSTSRINHKTYLEDTYKITMKEDELRKVVKFLLEIERINWKRIMVKNLKFSRDPKNKDIWSSELNIIQLSPKTL